MTGDNRRPNEKLGHFWAFVDRAVKGCIWICGVVRRNWGRLVQWIGKRWGIDAERVLGKLAVRTGLVLMFLLCVAVLYSGVSKSLFFVRTKLNATANDDTTDDVGDFDVVLLSAAIVGVVFFAFNKQRQKIDKQQTEIHSFGQKIQALTDALDNPGLGSELARFLKPDFVFWFLPTPDDWIAAYRLVTKLKPDDPKAYCNLALAYERHGKHDDAVAACRKAITLKPNDPMLWFSLGLVYRHQNKHHDAISAYRQAFKVQPDFLAVWYLNAGTYPKEDRNYDAIDAVEFNPSWLNLALTSEYQDNALAAYRQEIKLQPDDPYAWYGLGWTYYAQGKRSEALDALNHLRKLDSSLADKLARLLSPSEFGSVNTMKRRVRVLIGNSQPALNEVFLDAIAYSGTGQYELAATTTERAEQVLDYARSREFDLCIVVLNNLSYPPEYPFPSYTPSTPVADYRVKFTATAAQFVADLKRDSRLPVIAMAGEGATSCSSADYFFPLPFPVAEFMEAVKNCLAAGKGK